MPAPMYHATLASPGPMKADRAGAVQKGGGDLDFGDFLDAINPLQHLPGISTLYREVTGDTIKAPMKILGSAIMGGPLGVIGAVIDSVIEEVTGKDMGAHVMAFLTGEDEGPQSPVTVAGAQAPEEKARVTIDIASAEPVPGAQEARLDLAAAPPPPAPAASLKGPEAMPAPGKVAPLQLASVTESSAYEGTQIPRELMEALYRMHQQQYQDAHYERPGMDTRF